jgi:hypothetical protein
MALVQGRVGSMNQTSIIVRFRGASMAEANQLAAELQASLERIGRDVAVVQAREDADTQGFGAISAALT